MCGFKSFSLVAATIGALMLVGARSTLAQQTAAPHTTPGMTMGQPEANNPEIKAFMDANAKMHQAMSGPLTGKTDWDFALSMIPHHQGAIDMARVELKYGTDPEMRKLAQDIIAAQEKEIAFMKQWQQRHN